ncbi:hypothetical protein FDN13_06660 [Caloramator sp. E03]|uniref:CLC_0170 family protein n=1 Tax=Caloramator sp. E03 TaxID=2576307 RepID=UPI00111043CC|nr:CLC_0170 family protein [Caloramator sp. E03]QCX33416.1 hypothetical protein FDN13_06660 [Caloramator sp. E03]
MYNILSFIVNTFDLTVYILFLISGAILIFIDSKDYKKNNLTKEYKFTRVTGILYIIFGTVLFIAARYIRI